MQEVQESRTAPSSWREYFGEMKETITVFRWVYGHIVTPASVPWLHRAFAGLVVMICLEVAGPYFVGMVFDSVIPSGRNGRGLFVGLGGFALVLFGGVFAHRYFSRSRERFKTDTLQEQDDMITRLFFEKSLGQHIQESAILNVANIDKGRERVHGLQDMLLFNGIPSVMRLTVSFLFLCVLNWQTGAVLFLVIAANLVWMTYLNFQVARGCTPLDTERRRINRYRLERLENVERVKTNAKEKEELHTLSAWFDAYMSEQCRFWLWFIGQNLLRGVYSNAGLLGIVTYGTWLLWSGEPGWSIAVFLPIYMWSNNVVSNIDRIRDIEEDLHWNMPPVRSMIEALSLPPDIVVRENAVRVDRSIPVEVVFQNIGHTYPVGEEDNGGTPRASPVPVLKEVSFSISERIKLALIAPSGAGKTTLMRLLLRFMDPDHGRILVNGVDLKDVELSSWMRSVGYIPQHAQILDGSVRYNLTYGLEPEEREGTSDTELWELMRLLKIDFGERLTCGLDTRVGRNGIKLSGGQAQRLMIGAAAIKRPQFMIIDEATSHLDSSTEKQVHEGLKVVLAGSVSALVVAHRLSTVRDLCNKFVVLKPTDELGENESQVEAIAPSFEELYTLSPTFKQLADDQDIRI